jgi:hypothetical protein
MNDITINIEHRNGQTIFSFTQGFIELLTFTVTDSSGEEIWTIHPSTMDSRRQKGPAGAFVAIQTDDAGLLLSEFGSTRPNLAEPRLPLCREIEYGIAPAGYTETAPAKPLRRNTSYCAIVLNSRASGTMEFVA